MKLLIDTLGSDMGYEEVVFGTLQAMRTEEFKVTFLGPKEKIEPLIDASIKDRISYISTEVQISNDESPALALRRKKDASMVLGFQALKEENYDGFLSCGSTGALLTGATLLTKRIEGIDRPAIMLVLPTLTGRVVVLDAGANLEISEKILVQFAQMGSIYAKKVLEVAKPRIGLLNIGKESKKGDSLRLKTYELLQNMPNFSGNAEPTEVLKGRFDVVVTDGFTGNIFLKTLEGTAGMILAILQAGFQTLDPGTRKNVVPLMQKIKGQLDYREYGSAPFLGIQKPVFKAHGSSDRKAIENGIYTLLKYIDRKVIEEIEKNIEVNHE